MRALTLLVFLFIAVSSVSAENVILFFEGFGYAENGFESSDPGDEIHLITRVINATAPHANFPYDSDANEYTLCVTGLISEGEVFYGSSSEISFEQGVLSIYEDWQQNSDWSDPHDIGNPPSTFTDGLLWLSGEFSAFTMVLYRELNMGFFEGNIALSGGTALSFFSSVAYAFGGALIPPGDPSIPEGYDLSLNGEIWSEEGTATLASSWSRIKSIF
ncbi:MAG: hypothetical protein QGG33_01700 [Candidatus Krumholzibacteria bacterium]|nr:hypothetical protein [Candidatus Krumholzibacteria bacterium]